MRPVFPRAKGGELMRGGQNKKCSDEEFIRLWATLHSATKIANHLQTDVRTVFRRRRALESELSIKLQAGAQVKHSGRVELNIQDGVVIVFSDAHYYPGEPSTAHRGLLEVIKRLKPKCVIGNGDMFDGATISRHPRIGWDNKPTVIQELEAVDERLTEIENAVPKGCFLVWPMGNHDARFETYLAANAPQFQGVDGFSLKDRFPKWKPCWSCWINDEVVVKHKYKGGIHATHNNTVTAGKTFVTGHLHSLKVTPYTDYNGTRYGVDTGTLADVDIDAPQFMDYLEQNPVNWRSGFAVLTFKDGKLMMPELAQVWNEEHIEFRGELINVS